MEQEILGHFPRLADAEQQRWQPRETIAFAVSAMPHYRELFAELSLCAVNIKASSDLAKLPLLSKVILLQHGKRLGAGEDEPEPRQGSGEGAPE